MGRRQLSLALAALCLFVSASAAVAQEESEAHYFAFIDTGAVNRAPQEFIVKITDPLVVQKAYAILDGTETREVRIEGDIVAAPVDYNERWSYHLKPESVRFFFQSIEHCDATPAYVEEHLDQVGTDFLINGHWCPYNSRLVREVKI